MNNSNENLFNQKLKNYLLLDLSFELYKMTLNMNLFKILVLFLLFKYIRSPPILSFLFIMGREGGILKNDYSQTYFWVKRINNQKVYYLKLDKQLIEVSKEVYSICKNSYQKLNYEINRDKEHYHYSNVNNIDLFNQYCDFDFVKELFIQDIVLLLRKAIESLTNEERYIITQLYFEERTEKHLAKELGVSQQKLHYHKKLILKKLKNILLKHI